MQDIRHKRQDKNISTKKFWGEVKKLYLNKSGFSKISLKKPIFLVR